MPSLNDYRGMQSTYNAANPYLAEGDMGGEMGEGGTWIPTNAADAGSRNQYTNWLNSMSPEQRDEFTQLANAQYNKSRNTSRLAFGAATAAMGGLGALYGGVPGGLGEAGLAATGAESFPVYSGSATLTDLPAFAGGGAVTSPVYGGNLPEFTNLNLETGLPAGGSGAEFGSPEQRASDYAGGYGSTDNVTPASVNSGGNPILDSLRQALGFNGSSIQQVSQAGKMGANLLDLYNNYQNKKRNQGFISNLNSLYGPNSPYAQQLDKSLARAYAASGRRSDVGGRNVELQARLAEMNGRLAPTLNTANNQQGMYQNRMLGSIWDLGNRTGLFDKAATGLTSLFGG